MYETSKGSYKLIVVSESYIKLFKNDELIKTYSQQKSAFKAFHKLALKEELA
jgi:hypothetical protein